MKEAYWEALEEGNTPNTRIPIMLVGQGRAGKTSLKRRLLGLPFQENQSSTTGIDVGVVEVTEKNAEYPWKSRDVEEFMTNQSEAETMSYKKTVDYIKRGDQKKFQGDTPASLKPPTTAEISKFQLQMSNDNEDVLRIFLFDFAGQSIYYDTHACFLKPHCPYVLVHDLSMPLDNIAQPRFKPTTARAEIKFKNPLCETNLDYFSSWLRVLEILTTGEGEQSCDNNGYLSTFVGEKFTLPPVLIALTNLDKVNHNVSGIEEVKERIKNVISGNTFTNVFPEFFLIDNTLAVNVGDDIQKLRKKRFEVSKAILEQEKPMPLKWMHFEAALSRKLSSNCRYIPVEEAKEEAKAYGVKRFDHVITYLHRQGVLVHFSGSRVVVLDPAWLANLFVKVITVPAVCDAFDRRTFDEFKKKGILFRKHLKNQPHGELLEELMQRFNLISPCEHDGEAAFYVPSVAPSMGEGEKIEEELKRSPIVSLFLKFRNKLVPLGLYPKLQVKLIIEWEKLFPNQQVKPSFYCNYSLLPLTIDGNVFDVYLIKLIESIKIGVVPKETDHQIHRKFARHLKAIICRCLSDLESPDQLFFGSTSHDLKVKCSACFGKGTCARHGKMQCNFDDCGRFWSLNDLQRKYDKQISPLCLADKWQSKEFDLKSVEAWLNPGM